MQAPSTPASIRVELENVPPALRRIVAADMVEYVRLETGLSVDTNVVETREARQEVRVVVEPHKLDMTTSDSWTWWKEDKDAENVSEDVMRRIFLLTIMAPADTTLRNMTLFMFKTSSEPVMVRACEMSGAWGTMSTQIQNELSESL